MEESSVRNEGPEQTLVSHGSYLAEKTGFTSHDSSSAGGLSVLRYLTDAGADVETKHPSLGREERVEGMRRHNPLDLAREASCISLRVWF